MTGEHDQPEIEDFDPDLPHDFDDDSCDLEPAPETIAFLAGLSEACAEHPDAVGEIGGNVMFHFHDIGSWTFITQGPHAGVHDEPIDEMVDCLFSCEEFVLDTLLHPERGDDVGALVMRYTDAGYLRVEGDVRVLQRLLAITQPQQTGLSVQFSRGKKKN